MNGLNLVWQQTSILDRVDGANGAVFSMTFTGMYRGLGFLGTIRFTADRSAEPKILSVCRSCLPYLGRALEEDLDSSESCFGPQVSIAADLVYRALYEILDLPLRKGLSAVSIEFSGAVDA